jgi:hypothetical protein
MSWRAKSVESAFTYLSELGVFSTTIGTISFIPWTKMTLGAALTVIGAFFPTKNQGNDRGEATITMFGSKITIRGAARFGVIVGGILLILGSIFDGYNGYTKNITNDGYATNVRKN